MRSDRVFRVAIGAWLVATVVMWNVVFESSVRSAEDRYIEARPPAAAAPASGIRAVMGPAVAGAARRATAWSLAPLIGGGAAVAWARRRRVRSRSA